VTVQRPYHPNEATFTHIVDSMQPRRLTRSDVHLHHLSQRALSLPHAHVACR
jgi:hypothetical protein